MIFNSYVSLPEGSQLKMIWVCWELVLCHSFGNFHGKHDDDDKSEKAIGFGFSPFSRLKTSQSCHLGHPWGYQLYMSPNWPACIQKYAIVKRPYLNFSTVFMPNMPSLGLCKEVGLLLSRFLSKRICGSPSSPSSFCDFLQHFASLRSRSRSTPR